MKVHELLNDRLIEDIDLLLAEDSPISSELKDLINTTLERPLDNVSSDIAKTVVTAAGKLKAWALEQMHSSRVIDNARKELLTKIINNPDKVARELALNIIKRKANI